MDIQEKNQILDTIKEEFIFYSGFEVTPEMSDDKEIMMALINEDVEFCNELSLRLKGDKELCLIVVEEAPWFIDELSSDLKKDIDIARAALKNKNKQVLQIICEYMNEDVKKIITSDRGIVLNEVKKDKNNGYGCVFKYVSQELQSDREVVMEAVKKDAETIFYVNESFRDDVEFMIEVVKNRPDLFCLASPSLKKNKAFVLFALRRGGNIFPYLDEALRGDREVLELAIDENGVAIEYASDELKNDPELRERAKQTMLRQIRELSYNDNLRRKVMMENDEIAEKWINDKSFMKEALAENPWALANLYFNNSYNGEKKWEFDETLAVAAVSKCGEFINKLPSEFRENRKVIIQAAKTLKSHIQIWRCVPEELKDDEEFIIELLNANPMFFKKISPQFQGNPKIKKIYEEKMIECKEKYKNQSRIESFNNKVRKLRRKRRDIIHEKSVSIIVRDAVSNQEKKVDILLAVLLDKRAQLLGYNNYGEQRKAEANKLPRAYNPSKKEQEEIKKLTQQIEGLEGREANE